MGASAQCPGHGPKARPGSSPHDLFEHNVKATCVGALRVAFEHGPLKSVLHVVVDPVAANLAKPSQFRLVESLPVHSQAHCLSHALVMKGTLGVLEARELQPPGSGQDRRQHQLGILLHALDELARHAIYQVGLTTLQHGHARGPLGYSNHYELLHVHWPVVILERFELQPGTWLLWTTLLLGGE